MNCPFCWEEFLKSKYEEGDITEIRPYLVNGRCRRCHRVFIDGVNIVKMSELPIESRLALVQSQVKKLQKELNVIYKDLYF